MARQPAFLFTGASGVIGRAMVERLAKDPEWDAFRLVAAQRSAPGKESHPRVLSLPLDLGDAEQVRAFASGSLLEFGPWGGAAFIAGTSADAPLTRTSDEDWENVLAVNARSCGLLLNVLSQTEGLIAENSSFLLISSLAGLRGNSGQSAYAASKGALLDLVERFQRKFAALGGRLNALLPPLVESSFMSHLTPESRQKLYAQRLLPDPAPEITCAESAAFLLSGRSSYVHGAVWHADSRISSLPWQA